MVVVGGGPAGAAAAILLARHGISVVVAEADPVPRQKVGECLPPGANPVLEALGLGDGVGRAGLASYGNRSVWGSAEPVEEDFVFGTAGVGWRLDRRRFEQELAGVAIEAGVSWRTGWRLIGCARRRPSGWSLRFDGQPTAYEADVVIDASGRAARFARLLGVHRIRHDRLVGALAYLPISGADDDSTTLVEATPDGWWYSLFLPGNRLVVAYMSDTDLLGGGLAARLDAAPATRERLGRVGIRELPSPRIRPAHSARLAQIVGPDWLAVGEAAVAYDPLTSYGITAALGSGYYAGAAVVEHLSGRPGALPAYAEMIDHNFARYLVLLHDRYQAEQRWPDAPFWRRRHRP